MQNKTVLAVIIGTLAYLGLPQLSQAATYSIDPAHSTIGFLIKHLTVSDVQGQFDDYNGTIELDPQKPNAAKAQVTIQAKSINTHVEKRDEHLRGKDFFDVDINPIITFTSDSVQVNGKSYLFTGLLTIKGVTKSITLPLNISGPIKNPMGGEMVIGLSGQTQINRQEFGITFNKQLDQGGMMIGDIVQININLEAHEKTETK